MWNHSKSLLLSAWGIRAALLLWIILALAVPFVYRDMAVLAVFYLVFVPVLAAMAGLHRMLSNIQQGLVFSEKNTSALRLTSWACFFAAVILLIGGCLWPVLVLASAVIGFMGLFARVIKNMLAEAICIKEENDFTI